MGVPTEDSSAAQPCPQAGFRVSPQLPEHASPASGHARRYVRGTSQGDTRPDQGTAQVLPVEPALIALQAKHGQAHLERLAAFGRLRAPLLLPSQAAQSPISFTIAVAAAMTLARDPPEESPEL